MAKTEPFVTRAFPVKIQETECLIRISFEDCVHLWNFEFNPEDEDELNIDYEDIIKLLPQIKEQTGLDLKVTVERKRVSRKEFYNVHYVVVNGKYLELGDESKYKPEQLQAAALSVLASAIYHHEIFTPTTNAE